MAVQINGNDIPTPTANGVGVDSEDALLRTILPKVLDAVGNGYNHVEDRLNEVQNERLPSLEAQIRAFEQSHAQVKGTSSQILSLKERLNAAEVTGSSLETLSQKCSSDSTHNAASIQTLSTKIDKLQEDQKHTADVARSFKNFPPEVDWDRISKILDSVTTLSATVEQFQQEKKADSRTIQDLSKTVQKLQAESVTDEDRVQAQSERLDKLQSQVGEHTSKLEAISRDIEKLQADRELDSSRLQRTSENLNKLQSQQAEKANRLSLNVLNEKVVKIQTHYERDRTADVEALVKKHNRRLEDHFEQLDKQFKQLSEQSRKTETVHSSVAGLNGAISALVKRVDSVEDRQNNAASSNGPINTLFVRVNKLESRDASIAKVNADAQTMLKRVEKLVGDQPDIKWLGAKSDALEKRVENLDRRAATVDIDFARTHGDVSSLEKRLQQLMKTEPTLLARLDELESQYKEGSNLSATVDSLLTRLKALESKQHADLDSLVERLHSLEDRYPPTVKRIAETQRLLELIETRLQGQEDLWASRETKAGDLLPRIKSLEDQKGQKDHKDSQIQSYHSGTERLASDVKALAGQLQDLEASKRTIIIDVADIDEMITRMGSRLNDLERQPDPSHLINRVQMRVAKLERQDEDKGGLNASIAALRSRLDALDSLLNVAAQAPLLSTHNIATTNGHRSFHKPAKAIDHSTRSISTASADVISAKESIEILTTPHRKQQQRKSSRTRSSEQTHKDERTETSHKASLKRTFDMSDADQGTARSRKRSRSEAARARPSIARISTGQSLSRRPMTRGGYAASSPAENAQSASRRNEAVQIAVATDEEDSEEGEEDEEDEESEDEIALRRTSRTVKPTERGSQLTFLETTAKKSL